MTLIVRTEQLRFLGGDQQINFALEKQNFSSNN